MVMERARTSRNATAVASSTGGPARSVGGAQPGAERLQMNKGARSRAARPRSSSRPRVSRISPSSQQMDAITAGDGARRNEIEGKGRIAAKTTARVFRLLNLCGLPTHYMSGGEDDDNNEMLVRRAQMIPLEVVMRGVAAGSFVQTPSRAWRAARCSIPRMIEFFFKDDANHDPLIEPEDIVAQGIATPQELGHDERARADHVRDPRPRLAATRHAAGRSQDRVRPDRVGRRQGPARDRRRRRQRRLAHLAAGARGADARQAALPQPRRPSRPNDLDVVRANYEQVAETRRRLSRSCGRGWSRSSPTVRRSSNARPKSRACSATFGLPTARHIVSAIRTPGYVLQLVSQLDATFARLLFVTVGAGDGALAGMIEYATRDAGDPRAGRRRPRPGRAAVREDVRARGYGRVRPHLLGRGQRAFGRACRRTRR